MADRPPPHTLGHAQPQPQPLMTSDELDWLVHSYLEEAGYHHTSFSLLHESALAPPSSSSSSAAASPAPDSHPHPHPPNGRHSTPATRNPVMDTVVPPGHLVRILQKGLLYLDAEARYRGDSPDQRPRLIGYPIPTSLPLPPLPKYVPAPAPAPSPPSAPAKPSPPVSGSSGSGAKDPKGKGKAKAPPAPPAASTSAATAPASKSTAGAGESKRKGPANASDREEGNAEGPKRPRTASAETPGTSASGDKAGAGVSKKKGKAPASGLVQEREREEKKDVKGKGKARATEEADGDVAMEDAAQAVREVKPREKEKERPSASAKEKEKERERSGDKPGKVKERERERDGSASSGAGAGAGSKREREREKKDDPDLRPPPPKKTAASAPSSTSTSASAATQPSATANTSAASAAKRSTSPNVSRKAVPKADSTSSISTPSASAAPRIRITTKTVSVPASSSSSAARTANAQRPSSSGSGSGAGAGDADRFLKVKTEGDPSGPSPTSVSPTSATSTTSTSKNGHPSSSRPNAPSSTSGPSKKPPNGSSKDRLQDRDRNQDAPPKPDRPKSAAAAGVVLKEVDMSRTRVVGDTDRRAVVKLVGHAATASVQPCAFNSKVPSLLATGGGDSSCRIWDVPTPLSPSSAPPSSQRVVDDPINCKHASAQRKITVAAVAWDPSGSLLATGSEDGIARIWTPSGDLHLVLSMHQRAICSLKWSPSGTLLLTSSLDQTVCLWELSSGKVRQQYATHGDSVLSVDWLDDQTWASASMDKTVHLLSTTRPTPLHRFRGHRDEVNGVKFSPCGTLLASCSDDGTVRIHSLRTIPAIASSVAARAVKKGDRERRIDKDEEDGGGGGTWVLEGHTEEVHQVAWHPRAGKEGESGPRLVASCSFDHTARLWDADAGTCLYTFARASDYVYSIAFEPGLGRWLATGSNDSRLNVWGVEDRSLLLEYTHSAPIYELTWNPPGTQIAVCGEGGEVAVVAFEGGKAGAGK
ncbi:hypothetical protein JCM10207_002231 [Rhodosporidiobolus poonsookiae]